MPDNPTADDILKAVQYAAERMLTTPIVIPRWIETTDAPIMPPPSDDNLPEQMEDTNDDNTPDNLPAESKGDDERE